MPLKGQRARVVLFTVKILIYELMSILAITVSKKVFICLRGIRAFIKF